MATTYDRRRPRIPADLGRRIDEARGQLYFDAFVRQAVEAALGLPDEGPKAQPPRGSGSPGTTAPAPPRASDDVRRREPDPRMFKTAGDHRRAMARFNARGEW